MSSILTNKNIIVLSSFWYWWVFSNKEKKKKSEPGWVLPSVKAFCLIGSKDFRGDQGEGGEKASQLLLWQDVLTLIYVVSPEASSDIKSKHVNHDFIQKMNSLTFGHIFLM